MPPFELYHGASNEGQSALGFALSELQAVDVLQSNSVLIHLLTNDKFYTPAAGEKIKNKTRAFNTVSLKCSWPVIKSRPLQYKELPVSLTFPKKHP